MSDNEPVAISGINIKIGSMEATITMDEAKKLKEALDEIFPAIVDPIQIHWSHQPYYIKDQPYSPQWQFSGSSASLSIEAEGNIIT